jgi:hypothetical protein
MTVFRALRDAARGVVMSLAIVGSIIVAAPSAASADDAVEASTASTASTVPAAGSPTTVRVASEAPSPVAAAADAPQVGPLDAGVGGTAATGVWWLFGLGALQVAGLFVMTRRARIRLSTPEPAP